MTTKLKAVALATALAVPVAGMTNAQAHHGKTGAGTEHKAKLSGQTTITLNDANKAALAAQGIAITPIDPATSSAAGSFTFPIAGGKVDSTTLFGFVGHKGGVKVTKGDNTAKLSRFVIVNGKRGASLFATAGHRFKFRARGHHGFKKRGFARAAHHGKGGVRWFWGWRWHTVRVLSLTNIKRTDQDGKVVATADAALTKQGAKFLNRKLDTTLFSDGQAIGTVQVTAAAG